MQLYKVVTLLMLFATVFMGYGSLCICFKVN